MILILDTETTSPPKHNSLVEWYPLVVGGFKEPYKFFNMRKDGAFKGTQFGNFARNFIGTIFFSQYGLACIHLLATRLMVIFTK